MAVGASARLKVAAHGRGQMTKAAGIKGSAVVAGATDWSRVRETVLMMELAVGQIEAAMRDSDSSVKVLTDTFADDG